MRCRLGSMSSFNSAGNGICFAELCVAFPRKGRTRAGLQDRAWRRLLGTAACVAMLPISCDLLNRPAVGQLLAEHVRQSETINGVVTDPSGAVVPGAAVTLMGPNGAISATKSGPTGRYTLRAEPGTYTLVVEAKGFANFASEPMQLEQRSGREERNLDVRLKIALLVDVQVPEDSALDGDRSGMTLVLNARQVEQMPMDSKALLEELQGLAGSPNARVVVDGFSDSKLPPRDSIREVRINQNPYSAENDTDTVSGVIQVLSKPGTNQLHGYAYLYGDDSALNAENPFARDQPPYYADGAGGDVTGSMNDRTSFYTLLEER